jgi:Bifunctional DNA primase/polymerase, N-terminal/Primase C terminal 1 (PriCT-1)
MSALRDAAPRYAERRTPIFPCRPGTKVPATPHGFRDATTDPHVIERWWRSMPEANIGMATGEVSGIVVLDVDPEHGGDASMKALLLDHHLPDTTVVETPRGGWHFYFRHPGRHVACSEKRLGHGVDFRGDGGYALVPPSIVGGGTYTVVQRLPLPLMPDWLDIDSHRPTWKPLPNSEWLRIAQGVDEGERNSAMTRVVGQLLGPGPVNAHLALALVLAWNAKFNRPPLPEREVARIVDSIAGRELRRGAA